MSAGPPPEVPGYDLERQIGKGRNGKVYLAREAGNAHVRVAVKLFAANAEEAFLGEIEALRRVEEVRAGATDLHVMGALGSGEAGGQRYIVFTLAERGSVLDLARDRGPLPAEEAARIVADVARTVAHLHAAGLTHRDLKPANLLLGTTSEILVADLGTARSLGRVTTAAGTPAFAPPEVLRGERSLDGRRVDVYALGATLHFLLTGVPPTPGRPDAFALERARVPRGLQRLMFRWLASEPAQRPDDARVVATQLASWLTDAGRRQDSSIIPRTSSGGAATSPDVILHQSQTGSRAPAEERSSRRVGVPALAIALLVAGALVALWAARRDAPRAVTGSLHAPPTAAEAVLARPTDTPAATSEETPIEVSQQEPLRTVGTVAPPSSSSASATAMAEHAAGPDVVASAAPATSPEATASTTSTTAEPEHWISIPGGKVSVGSPPVEVTVAPFRIARRRTTIEEYERFLASADGRAAIQATCEGPAGARWLESALETRSNFVFATTGDEQEVRAPGDLAQILSAGPYFWSRPERAPPPDVWSPPRGDRSVVGLSWFEAEAFALARGARLPTVAERTLAVRHLSVSYDGPLSGVMEWCEDADPARGWPRTALWSSIRGGSGAEEREPVWRGLSAVRCVRGVD